MMLLDTNIVSAYLKGQGTKLGEFVAEHLATEGLAISYVTQFELRRSFEKLVRQNQGRGKLVLSPEHHRRGCTSTSTRLSGTSETATSWEPARSSSSNRLAKV